MSDPVQVAMIGLGFGAEFIPIYQAHPDANVAAVCRRNETELNAVADQFGIDLRRVSYGPEDVVDGLRACVHHADQPHGDFSFILIRKLCEQAHKDGYIVAFNGDGPDEIMGGFSHNEAFFSHQMRSNFPLSHYFQAINPEAFRPINEFKQDLDKVIDILKSVVPYDPNKPVMVAGEPELKTKIQRLKNGVPINENLLSLIRDIAERAGVQYLLDNYC